MHPQPDGPPSAVVALIATHHRPDLLCNRALASVMRQSRPCARIVVVDDGADPAEHARLRSRLADVGAPVDLLRNRRTPGASGAWNTGLDHLARQCADPSAVHVALLDDDDAWEAAYLAQVGSALDAGAEVVASAFWRIVGVRREVIQPPPILNARHARMRNTGIQASNLVVRLDRLLEAGLFDEALRSCTDRDLVVRLAQVCAPHRYRALASVAVEHYACTDRRRLSAPGSEARRAGLEAFRCKHAPMMSTADLAQADQRAQRLFGWTQVPRAPVPLPALPHREAAQDEAAQDEIHLIVGFIADDRRTGALDGLLGDLHGLRGEQGLAELDVLILHNGPDGDAAGLDRVAAAWRRRGLRIHVIGRSARLEACAAGELAPDAAGPGRLPIGPARTALQTYLYHFARQRPGAVVWIVDDDMRLDALVAHAAGHARRRLPITPRLQALRDEGLAIAVGPYTGSAPLPSHCTVRVQLLDLVASLEWLMGLDPQAPLPDRTAHNRAARAGRRDHYHDLSRLETDRLETPFLVEPALPGETVAQALARVAAGAERILAGEAVFRPLVFDAQSPVWMTGEAALHRGGNTFVFDVEALRDVPNLAPAVQGRPTRRSDMLWALLQQRRCGRALGVAPIPLFHDRRHAPVPDAPDVDALVDDIRGFAVFNALNDRLDGAGAPADLAQRCRKYRDERLAAFRLAFHRIRGLTGVVQRLSACGRLGSAESAALAALGARLDRLYAPPVLAEVERRVHALDDAQVETFAQALDATLHEHHRRLAQAPCIGRQLAAQRIANAMAAVECAGIAAGPLRALGQGCEGVALTDGVEVYKCFDYWQPRQAAQARAMLASLPGRWRDTRALYPLRSWETGGGSHILRYGFEPTPPYRGGHGPGLVDLLAECHRHRLICRNLHPDNLRVTESAVRLIDYGADLRPGLYGQAFDDEFAAMCRRAFLCWRWAHRADLRDLLRHSVADARLPELHGFETFFQAVALAAGIAAAADPFDALIQRAPARRVLDFGCGKGRQLRALAPGTQAVAFDPDPAMRARVEAMALPGVRVVATTQDVLAAAPYHLLICRRVACLLDDAALTQALAMLRRAVADDGRLLFGVCHPAYTARCMTPEAGPARTSPQDPDATFTFEKAHRHTGRRWREFHRPERLLRQVLGRAGWRIAARHVRESVDLQRFEPIADLLVYELVPAAAPQVTLMIKACAMESDVLAEQVRHLVTQLEGPATFAEVLLCLDSRREGFARPYAPADPDGLAQEAEALRRSGWVDRVLTGPCGQEAAALAARWLGHRGAVTHAGNGAPLAAVFAGFEACTTRYVLHADLDVMIGRTDRHHDYLGEMVQALVTDPAAVTVAFNIARYDNRDYGARGPAGPWRCESRIGLVDLVRLRALTPLHRGGAGPVPPWHRLVDCRVAAGAATSLRGGDRRAFFIHPPNHRKPDQAQWARVRSQVEAGCLPHVQYGQVEWAGQARDWRWPALTAPYVFVVCGRNVAPERFRRCLDSLLAQTVEHWQAIVVDDASCPAWSAEWAHLCAPHADRVRLVRRHRRQGLAANTADAIRSHCANPRSVILTVDADDCLIGPAVLEHIGALYAQGADLTVGGMLRTDKDMHYPVCFADARRRRGAGNVWQHLRTFRRALFDAVGDADLQLDGRWIELASDWALMLPLVEAARAPRAVTVPVYLHEPSGPRDAATRVQREAVIGRIVAGSGPGGTPHAGAQPPTAASP